MGAITQHIDLIKQANKITNRRTIYAAGAGLIPFPIVDAAALLAIQLSMVQSIGKLYDISFNEHIAKSLIGSLVASVTSVSLIKLIPGIGTILGAATASVTGAASTYALGKVFTLHFDQGGTLLDFNPITSREYFQKEYEEGYLFIAEQNIIEVETVNEETAKKLLKEEATREKTTRELLIEETEELYQILVQLQKKLDVLQAEKNKRAMKLSTTTDSIVDFTVIEGIGPKTNEVLKLGRIMSMEDLSKASVERLQAILKAAGGKFNLADPSTWTKQAALIVEQREKELKANLIEGESKSN